MSNPILPCKPYNNLLGQVFGRLTVVSIGDRSKTGEVQWRCQCSCGSVVDVRTRSLTSGNGKSCGCLKREMASARAKHRLSRTPEQRVWAGIVQRCTNPKVKSFKTYGAIGITICDRWRDDVKAFVEDMGKRPSRKHEIDRIDNKKGYEPGNCRWVLRLVNANNRSTNKFIEFNGERMTAAQWARRIGVSPALICKRMKRHSDPALILAPKGVGICAPACGN